ncbi:hypothetical protein ACIQXD_23630 [Streptomyces uncialis]|uniref:hypothetical protein n=1 Tax=Streptomyces uncialis TaxID=1048205 RepID=UPI0038275A77
MPDEAPAPEPPTPTPVEELEPTPAPATAPPAAVAKTTRPASSPALAAALLDAARRIADTHRAEHGTPITAARAHAGPPEHDPDTTLVVGHWDYLVSGYSPGGALLAAHVWHRRELERQFTAEGGC